MRDDAVLKQAIDWMDLGHSVALAVVVSTWGSSPRPVGSHLAINEKGEFTGSVSGGCVEPMVISEALDIISEGGCQTVEYGVTDKQAQEVLLTCGGNIQIFIAMAPERIELNKMIADQPVTRTINLNSGTSVMLADDNVVGSLQLNENILKQVQQLHKESTDGIILTQDDAKLFVLTYNPPRKLIIIGAVHITKLLTPMAIAAGFNISVIDSRPAFTNSIDLHGVTLINERTEQALQKLSIDANTALVILSHDPILDDPALHVALASSAYYIGCLGSRRTHAKRLERLRQKGFDKNAFKRLRAPVGLDIGSRTSAEIAISIIAEIIAVGNGF